MDNVEKVDVQDVLYLFKQRIDNVYSQLPPKLEVTSWDSDITVTNGTVTLQPAGVDGNVYSYTLTDYGIWTASGTYRSVTVNVDSCKIYKVNINAYRYGYRINKHESDPYESVEYLYDAVGMTPAKMNFSAGVFEYGDWADVWFVKDNKPCMLKSDGSVDYFLDPDDYSLTEDGEPSDVANTFYDGNAMAQIPLCWVYRYEDDNYYYEIVSNAQFDENYKAYAHTDKDGNIKDYFYRALFGASGGSNKLRSISGQSLAQSLTTYQCVDAATANGEGWYIDTWSQRELIRTLLILVGKSLDAPSVFGHGNCRGSGVSPLAAGTLSDKGQFYGYNSNTQQVKVFHVEGFWGDQWLMTAGVIDYYGTVYVKMTPEGDGYQIDNVDGYTSTNVAPPIGSKFISKVACSEFGIIPLQASGSSSTYFCDILWTSNSGLFYIFIGGASDNTYEMVGLFTWQSSTSPSSSNSNTNCAISYI